MIHCRNLLSWLVLFTPLLGLAACGPHHYVVYKDQRVMFFLDYPEARVVSFASSANDFKLQPARRDEQGRWFIDGMQREDFQYFYIVDGKVFIPDCRYRQQDDFGNRNCIYQP